jgi:hypothetical protein
LEAHSVAEGNVQQTGPEEWKWVTPDGQELDEEPVSWPRRVELKYQTEYPVLNGLLGQVVSSESELAELIRSITRTLKH